MITLRLVAVWNCCGGIHLLSSAISISRWRRCRRTRMVLGRWRFRLFRLMLWFLLIVCLGQDECPPCVQCFGGLADLTAERRQLLNDRGDIVLLQMRLGYGQLGQFLQAEQQLYCGNVRVLFEFVFCILFRLKTTLIPASRCRQSAQWSAGNVPDSPERWTWAWLRRLLVACLH